MSSRFWDRIAIINKLLTLLHFRWNMHSDLTIGSIQQRQKSPFDFLKTKIGSKTVNAIPVYVLPENFKAGEYPRIWNSPNQMPSDVVKGVFPGSNRPFLALRCIDFETHQFTCQIFFQRHNSVSNNWASTENLARREISMWDQDKGFEIIKKIIEKRPLSDTDNRALPSFGHDLFAANLQAKIRSESLKLQHETSALSLQMHVVEVRKDDASPVQPTLSNPVEVVPAPSLPEQKLDLQKPGEVLKTSSEKKSFAEFSKKTNCSLI